MTKTEVAERVARETAVFVRQSRRQGATNLITRLALQETAERLGLICNIKTAERISRQRYTVEGEVK